MQRRYFSLSILILAALLAGCASRAAAQPAEVRTLESPTLTERSEKSPAASAEPEVVPHDPPLSCPITRPPDVSFVPPAPYPAEPPERYVNEFWYGTPELWTMLGAEGTWYALPQDKNGYSQKIFWWSRDFDTSTDPFPDFLVTMEQLDVQSSPIVVAEEATNASADFGTAMLTGVEVPTPGCWKITGQYQETELSFVVWVTP